MKGVGQETDVTDGRTRLKVLVIGATGYIGSALAEALTHRGHGVVALSRRGHVEGYLTVDGDLTRPQTLVAALDRVRPDAVVHAGRFHVGEDLRAVSALLDHGVPVVYASGIWWLGKVGARPFAEDPPSGDSARAQVERALLAAAGSVRTAVIRPAIVYGRGGGIPAEMVGWARAHGVGRYVGSSGIRWPTVHVDDLAELFVLAIERAQPGAILHGVGEEAVPVADIAAAADRAAGGSGRAEAWSMAEAAAEIGEQYATWLALDQAISSAWTRESLGWKPTRPTLVQDLSEGSYVR